MNGSRDMELSLLDIGDLAKFSPVTESEGGGGGR